MKKSYNISSGMPTSHITTLAACQLPLNVYIIPAIGMLLKHIFRGSQKKLKTPPFLYYIPLKGFAKNTKWRLNKI
jgi:hypothetical protein